MAFEKSERSAELQGSAEDQGGRQQCESVGQRPCGRARRIGARLVQLLRAAMMMMRHWSSGRFGVRANDNRHRAMLERRHESGRTEQPRRHQ